MRLHKYASSAILPQFRCPLVFKMSSTVPTAITTIWENLLATVEDNTDLQLLSSYAKTVVVTLGIIINAIGIVGNSSILWAIVKDNTLRKPYNALLGSMAVNDVILCGVVNMLQVAGIYSGEFPLTWPSQYIMCKLHTILWVHLLFMTMMHIIVIAVHRYLVVFRTQLSQRITNKRTVPLLIVGLHLASLALFFKMHTKEYSYMSTVGLCLGKVGSSGYVSFIIFATTILLAAVALLFSYMSIHRKVYAAKKQLELVNVGGENYADKKRRLTSDTRHKKILKCMISILVIFLVGYIPGLVAMGGRDSGTSPVVLASTMLILWISNAINALVYGILDSRFRRVMLRMCNNKISPVD